MSSERDRIGIAVFGAGYWGTKLVREYTSIEDSSGGLKLSYVVDASKPTLDLISSQLNKNGVEYCTDYERALRSDKVDAVHIALPNKIHYEIACSALEAGKHVLLEKPMAMSSREAFKLARMAEERGLVLQVGHIFRFNNALRRVRAILKSGTIGRIFYAKLVWTAYMPPPSARDIVMDLAPHPIDILNFLVNEWPTSITAIGESFIRRTFGEEEVAFINLEYPDLFLANVYLSWIQHGSKERSVQIVCENGTIICDVLNQTLKILTREKPLGREEFEDILPNNTIREMEMHFIDRIRGRGPQFNSAMIGAQTVQVLETINIIMRARRDLRIRQVPSDPLIARISGKEIETY